MLLLGSLLGSVQGCLAHSDPGLPADAFRFMTGGAVCAGGLPSDACLSWLLQFVSDPWEENGLDFELWGHFTQLVWKANQEVGCGAATGAGPYGACPPPCRPACKRSVEPSSSFVFLLLSWWT